MQLMQQNIQGYKESYKTHQNLHDLDLDPIVIKELKTC